MRKPVLLLGAALLAGSAIVGASRAEFGQVSRLPALPDPPTDPLTRQMFDEARARGADIINLNLVLGHAPLIAKGRRALVYALRFEAVTPRLLREIAILRTAQIADSDYEINQHIPLALTCGLTRDQLDALPKWRDSALFDEQEKALLAYVDAMALQRGEVDDATYDAFARVFTPQEIVELTVTISSYYGNAMFTRALRIESETDGRIAAPGKC